MSFPYMPGESDRVRRLAKEQARVESAGKISRAVDMLMSALGFVAGLTVAMWIKGEWYVTAGEFWIWTATLAIIVAVRVAWLRYRFRRIVRKVNREMEIDHPWPDSK